MSSVSGEIQAGLTAGTRYGSSYRVRSVAETLALAAPLAAELGVTRVTDITRLDWLGVPVFVSIRPDAQPGSLCVSAGKGLTADEARVGAFMEAIELACAEPGRSPHVRAVRASAREVLGGDREAILRLCPVVGSRIYLDRPMACVEAEDAVRGGSLLVPSELVLLPEPQEHPGPRYFGANSNGLCSGNSVLEATVHGLAEVVERDIHSFQLVRDTSAWVPPETFPPGVREVADTVIDAGLALAVRHQPNVFGLPFFSALLVDTVNWHPAFVNSGFGCHPDAEIALARAVCEAVQSRTCFIHGGRDDLTDYYSLFDGWSAQRRREHVEQMAATAARRDRVVSFDDVPDRMPAGGGIAGAYEALLDGLDRAGLDQVLRVVYTAPDQPLHVVRVLVPGCEFYFEGRTRRVGRRLEEFAHAG